MATRDFFPYPTAPAGVGLSLAVVGHRLEPAADGTLRLYELGVDAVSIQVTAVVDPEVTRELGADVALAEGTAELWLIGTGVEGRLRQGWRLRATSENGLAYQHVLEFPTNDLRGALELVAVLVPASPFRIPGTELVLDRGMRLAWSPVHRVLFSELPTPPGGTLDIEWVDFQHDRRFRAQATQMFALGMSDDRPAVFLNEGVDDLKVVLMSRGTHGRKARIRDAVFMQIVHQVWTSIIVGVLTEAFRRMQKVDESDAISNVLADMESWQRTVIEDWAPHLVPEAGAGDEAGVLLEELRGHRGVLAIADIAMQRIPRAIQGRLDTRRSFDGLLRDAGQFS